MPYGISEEIDRLCERIEQPNVNSGWAAVTADGETVVWTVCDRFRLPAAAVVYSVDKGKSWTRSRIFNVNGEEITDFNTTLKVMADRVNEKLLYGFGNEGEVFVSDDKGRSFQRLDSPLPRVDMGFCDGRDQTEIRCQYGKEGVVWLALGEYGLWRMTYEDGRFTAQRVTDESINVFAQGMGKGAEGSNCDALYIAVNGENGCKLLRSLDDGKSWQAISGEGQYFGNVTTICGDYRRFGRVYVGTGGRGLFVGEESS